MKLTLIFLILIQSAFVFASAPSNPWNSLVMPQFFKNQYFDDLEAPLVDVYNDTGTNLCLLINKKPSVINFESRWAAWEEAGKVTSKPDPIYFTEVESYLQKNLPNTDVKWKENLSIVRAKIKERKSWWNYQPLACGEHEKGVSDFFNFIQTMDLKENEKAQYLNARVKLSALCESLFSSDQEEKEKHVEEVKKYVSSLQEMIQKSTLKERISDYLIALVESYAAMESSLPVERQKALTKTNIEFIRDSFSYYVTRKLTAGPSESEPASINEVVLPELEDKFSTEKTGFELWSQYLRDFPKGRFVKSAQGLLRRHSTNYVEEFEKYLSDPQLAPLSDYDCERLAYEIDVKLALDGEEGPKDEDFQKALLNAPHLFTIKAFQDFRINPYSSSDLSILFKSTKKPGVPSTSRQSLYTSFSFSDPLLQHLDQNKNFKKHPELRDLMKALVYHQTENYAQILKLPVSQYKNNKTIYLSLLRFQAWALEAQGKFPEARSLWTEIKKSALIPKSDLISVEVPLLENYLLAKKWDFNWNDFSHQPHVIALYLNRYATDEYILKSLGEKTLNDKIRELTAAEFLNRGLVTQQWNSLLQLKKVAPSTEKKLSPQVWTAIEKLSKQNDDAKSLLIVAEHILKKGQFIEDYSRNFGTFPSASFIFKPQNAGDIYLKVLSLTEKSSPSDVEAEALSHLSKCVGREYQRDYFCDIDTKKHNEQVRKAWFRKLHSKYKQSPWTEKTPYFY